MQSGFRCLSYKLLFYQLAASEAQLALTNGWNLVSLPLQPTDTNILSVLAPIQASTRPCGPIRVATGIVSTQASPD